MLRIILWTIDNRVTFYSYLLDRTSHTFPSLILKYFHFKRQPINDVVSIVAKKRDPGILDPELFLAQIRKVEARLGKLAKIRKVETD